MSDGQIYSPQQLRLHCKPARQVTDIHSRCLASVTKAMQAKVQLNDLQITKRTRSSTLMPGP